MEVLPWLSRWYPTTFGRPSLRCCRAIRPAPANAAGPRSMTEPASQALSSSSAVASPGRCCPWKWAAVPASPAGGGYGTGNDGASGRNFCTRCCNGLDRRRASTGSTAAWTARASAPFLGGPHRQKPHGSGQKRHQTARARRWQGHAFGPANHRGQPQRIARGDEPRGRHPADPGAAWSAAAETEGVVWGPAVWHAAKPSGPQRARDRRPPGTTADAARERLGQSPVGGGEHAVLDRPGAAPEDPVRQVASYASSFPLPATRSDLLQGSPEGFLK